MNKKIITAALLVIFAKLCCASSFDSNQSSDAHYARRSNISSFIVGGTDAGVKVFRFIIRVVSGGICGGSLLSPNWVLTAAHCVVGASATSFTLTAGEHDTSKPEGTEQVAHSVAIFPHQNYDSDTGAPMFDVALIKLATPFNLTDSVQPIQLASPDMALPGTAITAGWGALSSGSLTPATILQQVSVPFVADAQCVADYTPYYSVLCTMVCYGAQGFDACQGDSGGPLITYDAHNASVLIGIASWGVGCAQAGHPGVYTRVSSFRFWIETTMADNS